MTSTQFDPNLGQLLISRYQLTELIGKGSMGRVYRAEDTLLGGVPVAVKFLAKSLLSERMKMRFSGEARMGALLGQRSIHIVRVIDYGVNQDESPFYVMEYLEGENLSDMLMVESIPLQRFFKLIRHICLGLKAAHQGVKVDGEQCSVIHRDIKPSNVLVLQDTALGELAKVLDFGIAKFMSDRDSGQTQSFMGTLAYCSPEQIEGKELDNRSDIYSLGITMFEMLTTKMPLQAENHSIGSWYKTHHNQKPLSLASAAPGLSLPKALDDLIMACMAKSPADRPQTVQEILDTLQPLDQSFRTPEPEAIERPTLATDEITNRSTVVLPQAVLLSVEETCWQMAWPEDKPVAEIVFAQTVNAEADQAAAVWMMLPRQDIQKRLLNTRYNQFLFTMAPHPMMLWITAIYDASQGARWMPCYLDLKNRYYQDMALILGQTGYYPLLFFALEDPVHCANVMTMTIAPYQRQLLRDWVQSSQNLVSTAPASLSKEVLKVEFEKLKPKILDKLERSKSREGRVILE
ncbi:MAG: serine/threonine protein kinase [Aphanocapsa sp. GSE-SYN-MK-11-07L]|jgi:serine/threonine-protein kinase|nr:serine/threonine protein kinase [Aphanocapsa sp. GSE-SYN-MK-11-07L]